MNKLKTLTDGISCIFCGLIFLRLSNMLPEWIVGMMAVGAIVLYFCVKRVIREEVRKING